MEALNQLEQKVGALLTELATLRSENARLTELLTVGATTQEEVQALRIALAEEREVRKAASEQVTTIITRLQKEKQGNQNA